MFIHTSFAAFLLTHRKVAWCVFGVFLWGGDVAEQKSFCSNYAHCLQHVLMQPCTKLDCCNYFAVFYKCLCAAAWNSSSTNNPVLMEFCSPELTAGADVLLKRKQLCNTPTAGEAAASETPSHQTPEHPQEREAQKFQMQEFLRQHWNTTVQLWAREKHHFPYSTVCINIHFHQLSLYSHIYINI